MYENLKLHREVVDQVKYQLWPLDKKLRMIRQAKNIPKMLIVEKITDISRILILLTSMLFTHLPPKSG